MPKINQEEYEVLKELKDRYKWIARDKDGPLWVFEVKPARFTNIWSAILPDPAIERIYKPEFGFIHWEDEPYNIAELIAEYDTYIAASRAKVLSDTLWAQIKEEETEVKKDKEWLLEKIENYIPLHDRTVEDVIAGILEIAEKLDEPETLSPEWIYENRELVLDNDTADYYVPAKKLEKLLVPKQEKPKPIINEKTADLISYFKFKCDSTYSDFSKYMMDEESGMFDYYVDKEEEIMQAWLTDEYEIEEEPEYVVELPIPHKGLNDDISVFLNKKGGKVVIDSARLHEPDITKYGQYALTEEEIKEDFGWAWKYAKPVEEVNNGQR